MKKPILPVILSLLLFFNNAVAQKEYNVDGVIIPRTLDFQNKKLELNGFGTRSKMWVDIYIQSLFLERISEDPKFILDNDLDVMAIRIQITSPLVSSGKFTRNFNKGFEKSAGENLFALQTKIEAFKALLADKIIEKDVFDLIFNPKDKSIWVYKNDVFKGKIAGLDFKHALFSIWLGNDPVDEKLKNDLLGKV
jgi:hypothetical protein